jgi:hypothetical protein
VVGWFVISIESSFCSRINSLVYYSIAAGLVVLDWLLLTSTRVLLLCRFSIHTCMAYEASPRSTRGGRGAGCRGRDDLRVYGIHLVGLGVA